MPSAYAHTNIALVKYWGKRAGLTPGLNLPAVGSLSLTLDRFFTETTVAVGGVDVDEFALVGHEVSAGEAQKVSRFLDLVRALAGSSARARVTSKNTVPTAAGLALAPTQKKGAGRALEELAGALRGLPLPVVGRVAEDRLLLDLRGLEEVQPFTAQLHALRAALA